MELKEDTDHKLDKHGNTNCVTYKVSIERGIVVKKS